MGLKTDNFGRIRLRIRVYADETSRVYYNNTVDNYFDNTRNRLCT